MGVALQLKNKGLARRALRLELLFRHDYRRFASLGHSDPVKVARVALQTRQIQLLWLAW